MKSFARYLLFSALIGLGSAMVVVLMFPQWLQQVPSSSTLLTGPKSGHGPFSYAEAVDRAAPAVVNIFTTKKVLPENNELTGDPQFDYFYGNQSRQRQDEDTSSLGSGVIINKDGYILTNNHVVTNAETIQVLLEDGRVVPARLAGSDKETDLAILQVQIENLPTPATIAPATLRVGDVVLAIGNPFGVGKTVTMGIVSATGRNQLGINSIEDFIQTDAAINPGNSGGALVNAQGELIGINSAIYSKSGGSEGIGFAIPVSLALGVLEHVLEYGKVMRGWLGVEGQDITPELAESFGLTIENAVLIAGVVKDSPAASAGLKPGDIITELDGKPIESAYSAFNHIAGQLPGTEVSITGLRGGSGFKTRVKIAERPTVLE
jgi:serine protease DegS